LEEEGNWLDVLMKKMLDWSLGHPPGPSWWQISIYGCCPSQYFHPQQWWKGLMRTTNIVHTSLVLMKMLKVSQIQTYQWMTQRGWHIDKE
jgi:hypothetical protein